MNDFDIPHAISVKTKKRELASLDRDIAHVYQRAREGEDVITEIENLSRIRRFCVRELRSEQMKQP